MPNTITRRGVIGSILGASALHASGALGQSLPARPVSLNIIDVAGQLQLTQAGIDRFRRENPNLVSGINYSRAPSPELPGKLKAQQDANRVDIDLVLTLEEGRATLRRNDETPRGQERQDERPLEPAS